MERRLTRSIKTSAETRVVHNGDTPILSKYRYCQYLFSNVSDYRRYFSRPSNVDTFSFEFA
jgi:hypothetical protein